MDLSEVWLMGWQLDLLAPDEGRGGVFSPSPHPGPEVRECRCCGFQALTGVAVYPRCLLEIGAEPAEEHRSRARARESLQDALSLSQLHERDRLRRITERKNDPR